MATPAPELAFVDATIDYLVPGSHINRRFVAPGAELSTGTYRPEAVRIGNARAAARPFTLDEHGFTLARFATGLTDLQDQDAIDTLYAGEVARIATTLTGADLVLPLGAMIRHADGRAGYQPPAAEAHVDFNTPTAHAVARAVYQRAMPDRSGYDRFILFSLWRCWSPGPQDWPLALCDFASAAQDIDLPNVKIDVDVIPQGDARFAPVAGEDGMMAASIFTFNPAHRWWTYPDMTRDEVIFIKFHDSDHTRAWRALHTAFHDRSRPEAIPRESIEFRGCAYFLQK